MNYWIIYNVCFIFRFQILYEKTGDQVKQMAQGAANAVKNAVGMGNTDTAAGNTTTSTTTTTSKH